MKVLEDHTLIQNFKKSILEVPNPNPKDLNFLSPSKSSEDLEPNRPAKESIMVEGLNGATASQVQSWQIMDDDELSNCVHNSMDSSDCISQTLVEPESTTHEAKMKTKTSALAEDFHYQGIMATLFKDSDHLLLGPQFQNLNRESSFVRWKRGGFRKRVSRDMASSQRIVKKILFEVPRMHVKCDIVSPEENRNDEEVEEIGANHAASERKRRERLNEKFSVLKTIVPSLSKV